MKKQNSETCKGTKSEIDKEITVEVRRLEGEMEQLLGDFERINSAANAKLDSIEEQYSQNDTGIVYTGAKSGVAAPKMRNKWIPREKYQKRFLYYPMDKQ